MKIRKFFWVLFLASLFIVGATLSSFAADNYVMKIATVWGSEDHSANKSLSFLKPRIEQLTEGRVKVELHKGTLGGERDLFEGLQLGTIQAGAITTGTLGGFIPLTEIFMVPYLFKGWDHAWAVVEGKFGDHLNDLAQKKGLRFLAWWGSGGRQIYGNGTPVPTDPKHLKGKKIRVMETPFLVDLYRHYDALPTPMAYPEVYSALQQGVIDGCQAGLSSYSVAHHEVSEWIVLIDENLTLVPFVVSERWWSKLPNDIKGDIKQAILEATTVNHVIDQADEGTLAKKWAKHGVQVVKGDREAFRAKAREILDHWPAKIGGDKWLKWIDAVGEAFPLKKYKPFKNYDQEFKF